MNKLPINDYVISVFTKEIVPSILEEYKRVVKILGNMIDCIKTGEYKRPDLIINIDLPIFIANNKNKLDIIQKYTGEICEINQSLNKVYLKYNENQIVVIAVYDGIIVMAGKGKVEEQIVKFNGYLDNINFDLKFDSYKYIDLLKKFMFFNNTSKYYGSMYRAILIWGDYEKIDSIFEQKKLILPATEKKYLENIKTTLTNDCLNRLIKIK